MNIKLKLGNNVRVIDLHVDQLSDQPSDQLVDQRSDQPNQIFSNKRDSNKLYNKTLDQLLDEITVIPLEGCIELSNSYEHCWCAVVDDNGIVAWFKDSTDAYRYRLDLINRLLNPTVI